MMTEPDTEQQELDPDEGQEQPPTRRRWSALSRILAGATVLVAVLAVTVLIGGNKVLPWTTAAEGETQTYDDVRQSAEEAVLAFLDVDYRKMDDRTKAVQDASTGTFKEQYTATAAELKAAAAKAKSVSTGTVAYVGIKNVEGDSATTLVGADVVVENASTASLKKTEQCPHAGARCDQYRFVVHLSKTEDGWKMSNLAGVA